MRRAARRSVRSPTRSSSSWSTGSRRNRWTTGTTTSTRRPWTRSSRKAPTPASSRSCGRRSASATRWRSAGRARELPRRPLRRPPRRRGVRLLRRRPLLAREDPPRGAGAARALSRRDARGRRARRRGRCVPRGTASRRGDAELRPRRVAERARLAPPALPHSLPPPRHVARLRRQGRAGAPRHGRGPAPAARGLRHPVPCAGRGRDRGEHRLGGGDAPRDAPTRRARRPAGALRMTLSDALAILAPRIPEGTVCIHANGFIGRAGHAARDRLECFYMIGSMGLGASIGLGIALVQPRRRVLVLDGDGNVLMNLGTLATIAAKRPANLLHVCFDNSAHASTGAQPTISDRVRLDEIARAAGYRSVARVETADALAAEAPE